MAKERQLAVNRPALKLSVSFFVGLFAASLASAHECWLQPSTFFPAAGGTVRLTVQIGMEFKGETRPFDPQRLAALRHFSAAGVEDWTTQVTAAPEFPVSFATAGTHVVT